MPLPSGPAAEGPCSRHPTMRGMRGLEEAPRSTHPTPTCGTTGRGSALPSPHHDGYEGPRGGSSDHRGEKKQREGNDMDQSRGEDRSRVRGNDMESVLLPKPTHAPPSATPSLTAVLLLPGGDQVRPGSNLQSASAAA